jgi:hypothetical protein
MEMYLIVLAEKSILLKLCFLEVKAFECSQNNYDGQNLLVNPNQITFLSVLQDVNGL